MKRDRGVSRPGASAIPALHRWLARIGLHVGTSTKDLVTSLSLVLALGFAVGFATLAGFVALASEVMEQETQQVDLAVLAWLRQFHVPGLDEAARIVSALGSEVLIAVWLGLLVILALQRQWSAAVGLAIVTIGAALHNSLLKEIVQRTRPEPLPGLIPAQAFSFPSGHAMASAAFYGFLAIVTWQRWHGWRRYVTAAALVLLVVAIGLSRAYLGVHYITDVIAGCMAGFVWADAVALSTALLRRRGERRNGAEPPAQAGGADRVDSVPNSPDAYRAERSA